MSAGPRTTVLLIRHAQTDAVGRWIAGRQSVPGLNQCGHAEAERLRSRLSSTAIAAIYSSPLDRAVETAEPLARERGLLVEPKMELIELDFGEWTGQRFDRLTTDPRWRRFNAYRSMAGIPGGERAADAQARITAALESARERHPNDTVVFVTHGDIIRLAILYVAGAPLDFIHRFEISPASVTTLLLDDRGPMLQAVNERP